MRLRSSSLRSLILMSRFTRASLRIDVERDLPFPKIYVSPISARLLGERPTPATRAIYFHSPDNRRPAILYSEQARLVHFCLCLCFGLTQITRTTPLR